MHVHVADHPLIARKLTYLRDKRTDSPTFRRLAEELMTLLAYEATREVRVEPFEIETPVGPTTGIKLSNPGLEVIACGGDGDGPGVGAGHFVNSGRRNGDMAYMMFDNGVYGLTKGQLSASADIGTRPKKGEANIIAPIDPIMLGLSMGATFLARSFSGDKEQLIPILKAAVAHNGLALIDDSCEALGAEYGGARLGSHGPSCVFAFYPNKQITTGEGGLVVTDDPDLASTMRSLRNQGRDADGTWLRHVRLGFNYRIDELSAALGVAQLRRIDELSTEYGLAVANVFHAGDGNLHPLVAYDSAKPGDSERAEELAGRIVLACVEAGGSITGEHGVGIEKNELMPLIFSPDDLDAMRKVKSVFNPAGEFNPAKLLPSGKMCGELRVQVSGGA